MGSVTPVYAIRFPFIEETITDASTKNAADDIAAVLSTKLDADRDISLKRPAASAFRNGSQAITANTETNIQFTSEDFDTDAAINLGVNNTRITVPTADGGRWWVFAHVASIPGTTWTSGQIAIAKNGTDVVRRKYWAGSSQQPSRMQVTCQVPLVPTDFLTLTVLFQGTPSPTSIDGIRLQAQRLTT
jgi:ketosteroid isomerase-like protein